MKTNDLVSRIGDLIIERDEARAELVVMKAKALTLFRNWRDEEQTFNETQFAQTAKSAVRKCANELIATFKLDEP